jgi:hypothetical protein
MKDAAKPIKGVPTGKRPKNDKEKDLGWVWVPMQYVGNERPGVVLYTEETKYKLELKEYFQQPIVQEEGYLSREEMIILGAGVDSRDSSGCYNWLDSGNSWSSSTSVVVKLFNFLVKLVS